MIEKGRSPNPAPVRDRLKLFSACGVAGKGARVNSTEFIHDPQKIREAIHAAAGAMKGVDRDELLADLRAERGQIRPTIMGAHSGDIGGDRSGDIMSPVAAR